ncbi:MAG: hypothetical protein RL557_573 [archaeon]|jgi:hypothetical protein
MCSAILGQYPMAREYHATAFHIQDALSDLLHPGVGISLRIAVERCYLDKAMELFQQADIVKNRGAQQLVCGIYLAMDRITPGRSWISLREKIKKGRRLTEQLPSIIEKQKIPLDLFDDFRELDQFYFCLYQYAIHQRND